MVHRGGELNALGQAMPKIGRLFSLIALACVASCGTRVPQHVLNTCNGKSPGESNAQMEESCSTAIAEPDGLDGPNTAGALVNRGTARLANNEVDAAISDFSAAIQINPNLAPAYGDRAGAYLIKGNFAAAEADINRSIQLRPDDFRAYNLRCWSRAVENKKLDEALADCNTALKLAPDDPHVLDSLGVVEMRRGQYAEALDLFNKALKSHPDNVGMLYLRGVCERKTGDMEGGDADIATAKGKNPEIDKHYPSWE